jgi:TonB family protein
MSTFEKVGGFLLFERIEEDRLSKDMLAGQISGNQIQQVCVVKRFDSSLTTLPDFILDLNQEYEGMKSLSNPNIIKPSQFVQDKKEFAAVFDYVEGKSLRTVLNKCAQDGYPFTVDHALLVASRLCTALEYLHSKKVNEQRIIHGYVSPEAILVTYDGEIRLQYLGLAHALMKFPAGKEKLFHDYKNYLAPELLNHQKWDRTIDIYGAGLVLYEMLTGEVLDRTQRLEDSINDAVMNSNSGEKTPLTDELKKLLHQALSLEPSNRFASVADMRKALDLLLFSSEFSPTTFNLAFFMHSLFRESIDEETKKIGLYKKTDFSAHLNPEPPAPVVPPVPKPVKKPEPVAAAVQETPAPAPTPTRPVERQHPRVTHPPADQPIVFSSHEPKEKSRLPIFAGLLLILAVGAAIFYFFALKPGKSAAAKPALPKPAIQGLTPEQLKLQEEERKKLEQDALAAQAEARKKDEELRVLQAKLDALLKAQEQAKKKTEAEKEAVDTAAIKKLQQEAKRLEEEKKQQQALAEQKLKEAQAPPPPVQQPVTEVAQAENIASTSPPPVPAPTDGGQSVQPDLPKIEDLKPAEVEPEKPSVVEGQVVDLTPDVVRPEIVSRVNPSYPPIAQQKKIEGTVIIGVLISERGDVAEAKVLRSGGGYGLNEAALAAVRKWRFRPAVKEGKRVKVWMTYPIVFKLGKV